MSVFLAALVYCNLEGTLILLSAFIKGWYALTVASGNVVIRVWKEVTSGAYDVK